MSIVRLYRATYGRLLATHNEYS